MAGDVGEGLVQVLGAEGLADEPGMEVEDHEPSAVFAFHIQPIEAVLENTAVVHDGQYARPEQVEVVEVKEHGQRVHFAAGHLHAVGLVIVGPVAEVAQPLLG